MPFIFLLFTLLLPLFSYAVAPPAIQLATVYHQDINIEQYWVSEKLDGVRGYWDGKQLISRQGHVFKAPHWFIKDFPKTALDGELWIARQQFALVSGIVRQKKENNPRWQQISFMIFDLPNSVDNFSQRILQMKKLTENTPSAYLKMIPQKKVKNNTELQLLLEQILAKGGEGLMLHNGEAFYQKKRSLDLMKLKKKQDAEALVIQHITGKGRNSARLGALLVETSEGIQFKIGTGFSDKERENPPAIGSTITYQYIGKTKNGVPRFASFLRIRRYF